MSRSARIAGADLVIVVRRRREKGTWQGGKSWGEMGAEAKDEKGRAEMVGVR